METNLETWADLRKALGKATEEECQQLLDLEKEGKNRPTFLARIYGRYNMLRAERERRELAGGAA